jgi:hypothetical protein
MTLNDYIYEQMRLLETFRVFWQQKHRENPEAYPIELEEENTGLWDEQFNFWVAEAADVELEIFQ